MYDAIRTQRPTIPCEGRDKILLFFQEQYHYTKLYSREFFRK